MSESRGRLLVATPDLRDPNFSRTVVLMLEHGDEGALGVVLNRPDRPLGRRGAARTGRTSARRRRACSSADRSRRPRSSGWAGATAPVFQPLFDGLGDPRPRARPARVPRRRWRASGSSSATRAGRPGQLEQELARRRLAGRWTSLPGGPVLGRSVAALAGRAAPPGRADGDVRVRPRGPVDELSDARGHNGGARGVAVGVFKIPVRLGEGRRRWSTRRARCRAGTRRCGSRSVIS